jgi:hypothetical protein
VIDKSHNFRNKIAYRDHDSRYDRLMKKIIQSGFKRRVLMLPATPVNNRLADLKNQISFITEGDDEALSGDGIPSIEANIRQAQTQFKWWLTVDDVDRNPAALRTCLASTISSFLNYLLLHAPRKLNPKTTKVQNQSDYERRFLGARSFLHLRSTALASSSVRPIFSGLILDAGRSALDASSCSRMRLSRRVSTQI